jgi:Tol biopolymer transport system component
MKQLIITLLFLSSIFAADYRIAGPAEKIVGGDGQSFIQPVWSPDGSKIAFTAPGYRGIWVIDADSKNMTQISNEMGAGFGFDWSPDGLSIAMRIAKYEGPFRRHIIKVYNLLNNQIPIQKEASRRVAGLPRWTRDNAALYFLDGEQLVVHSVENKSPAKTEQTYFYCKGDKISKTTADQTKDNSWSPMIGKDILNLKVSPDEQKITFEVLGGNMFVQNADGTGLADLGKGYNAAWSPDGTHLVFMVTTDDGHEYLDSDLFIVRVTDGERFQLTSTPEYMEMNPSWSPDGKVIAYDEYTEGAIYLLPIEK